MNFIWQVAQRSRSHCCGRFSRFCFPFCCTVPKQHQRRCRHTFDENTAHEVFHLNFAWLLRRQHHRHRATLSTRLVLAHHPPSMRKPTPFRRKHWHTNSSTSILPHSSAGSITDTGPRCPHASFLRTTLHQCANPPPPRPIDHMISAVTSHVM